MYHIMKEVHVTTGQIAYAPARAERNLLTSDSVAGIGGLTFLILIVFQNVLRFLTSPANDASPNQLLQFAHDQAWTVRLLVVTYIIGYPALLLFAAGLANRFERAEPRAAIWGELGRMSVIVIAVFFAFVNLLDVLLVAGRTQLANDPNLTSMIWMLHNAIFTINLLAVAGGLLGLGWGAAMSGLISHRFGWACVAGAVLLGVAASPMVTEIHGSPFLGIGLLGYLCWILFLLVTSLRLLGTGENERVDQP